jgi:hypothetical protein
VRIEILELQVLALAPLLLSKGGKLVQLGLVNFPEFKHEVFSVARLFVHPILMLLLSFNVLFVQPVIEVLVLNFVFFFEFLVFNH